MATMTLGERLRRGIEDDILAGQLAPGDVIDERELAERYKVSRTPVREALLQLASLGLVTMSPRAPTRVTSLRPATLLQMTEVMCCLEAECARLAARRMQPQERERLRAIQSRAAQAVAAGDTAAFNDVNWSLHQAIFEGSHNGYLATQARQLRLRLHPYRCYLLRIGERLSEAHEQHQALVDAILAGDAQAAGEHMRRHLTLDSEQFADLLSLLPDEMEMAAEA
jgi:DNA-binding GntR family transcriptional regulator